MYRRFRACLPVALAIAACQAPGLGPALAPAPAAAPADATLGVAPRYRLAQWWDEPAPNLSAASVTQYYPDLQAIAPTRFYLDRSVRRPRLRFATSIGNPGPGHLQIRGRIVGNQTPGTQEILDPYGRVVATRDVGSFELHPDHGHFHVTGVARYELRAGGLDGPLAQRGKKISFCMEDSIKVQRDAGRARIPLCTREVQGLTRGYVDVYSADLPDQYFDLDGLGSGDYTIVIQLNPSGKFLEASKSNNLAWLRLRYDAKARTLQRVASYP